MSSRSDEMNFVAAATTKLIGAGRRGGLSAEDAVTAAMIGVFSVIRVDGLNEQAILAKVRQAAPSLKQMGLDS